MMSKRVLTTLDIPIPRELFAYWSNCSEICVVLTRAEFDTHKVRAENPARVLMYEDADYQAANWKKPPILQRYYEVSYIRECRLKDVQAFEWKSSPVWSDGEEFCTFHDGIDMDDFVKVVLVCPLHYSLRELNESYEPILD